VVEALTESEPTFISLIAAEHTAQLNAAQVEDVFSQCVFRSNVITDSGGS